MAPDIEVRPSPPARRSRPFRWWWLVVAAAVVVAFVASQRLLDRPTTVDRVALVNDTVYPVHVAVSNGARNGWMAVGTAQPKQTTVIADVIDQGAVWTVRLSRDGIVLAEVRVTRADLARAGWRINVPVDVAARLAQAGVDPPPT